ncbi:MAG: hypothetical protein KDD83_05525, partial [Caldilineaceae bacterium]|nr:hypothetical protein [Caldilineaceae bacterium]
MDTVSSQPVTSRPERARPVRSNPRAGQRAGLPLSLIAALTLLGLALRVLRLNWQPLWWDEGYSIYFATEPMARMLNLTAHDIHPPLYYALLHLWTGPIGAPTPVQARLLSVLIGAAALPVMAWLAGVLFPGRMRIAWLATIFLLLSPIHLFYSQEVRMYGLAMVLGMAATGQLWRWLRRPTRGAAVLYVVWALAALYTLYYSALLLLAHALWVVWTLRAQRARLIRGLALFGVVGVGFLPWLLYAGPKLVGYVGDKVQADQDRALGPLAYAVRHLVAMVRGHLLPGDVQTATLLTWLGVATVLAVVATIITFFVMRRRHSDAATAPAAPQDTVRPDAPTALLVFMLVPAAAAFLLNLRLPFFPDGGERLLLFILPYFLLLIAAAATATWTQWRLGRVTTLLLVACGALGVYTFYATPRYTDRDYRPVIGQVVQSGKSGDTFFAIFPWQVGYWRAYVPPAQQAEIGGPEAMLAAEGALTWGPEVRAALDAALQRGAVWFPAPLSFGSTLPGEIEAYLQTQAVNLENRWYSTTTRLAAWQPLPQPETAPVGVDFGPVRLDEAGVAPDVVSSTNAPVAVRLTWNAGSDDDLVVTLRLTDAAGRTWASRDYAPLGALRTGDDGEQSGETAGLIIPVGLPPDTYRIRAGVAVSGTGQLILPPAATVTTDPLVDVGTVSVTLPETAQARARLPIRTPVEPPEAREGLAFLGYAGVEAHDDVTAGTELRLRIFMQNRVDAPPSRHIFVSLLDTNDGGVAGWEGWTLPQYPTETWAQDALVQVPVEFFLPATVAPGDYRLITGLLDPATGAKSEPVELGELTVRQRPISLDAPAPATPLEPPPRFGTHADLIGYDLTRENGALALTLHWRVQQTLLPPHQIFVHLDTPDGTTVAQDDGPPRTRDGEAPTGSWLPGEYLSTQHRVALP